MDRKFVGKKAEPTAEELEFIYGRLGQLSDQEVLEEMQDTSFPLRSLGFIKRRRREFNAAKKVLEEKIKSIVPQIEFPDYLQEVIEKHYSEGMLRQIIIRTPSAQGWNNLSITQQNKWREIVTALGGEPEDYLAHMRRMLPKVVPAEQH